MNNSGLQIHLNQETIAKINYLNSMAAQTSQKHVEGKLSLAVNELTLNEKTKPVNNTNKITTQETAKDKNGSNPFYNKELHVEKSANSEEQTDEKKAITTSIFV